MIDLNNKISITSNLFVRIDVEYYKQNPGDTPTSTKWCYSDSIYPYTLDGDTYIGLGKFAGITETSSEIKATSGQLTLTLSGIPNTSIYEILNSKIKGCPVRVTRVLFDPVTHQPLDIPGNPLARYRGFINNYSLSEDYNIGEKSATNTLVLVCASAIDVLNNKMSGRKTNPYSQKKFFPNDLSMDRVPTLENSDFNFGAPKT